MNIDLAVILEARPESVLRLAASLGVAVPEIRDTRQRMYMTALLCAQEIDRRRREDRKGKR
mgnify:CR=1 FL=1